MDMARHVTTTIRYDGPALTNHLMDVQDLAPALLALADIVQIANKKFNGPHASMKVLVDADVEQRCFQLDLSLVQSILEQAKGFFADERVKTAEEIAKAIGLVAGGGISLFKLIRWLAGKREAGTQFQVTSSGGTTVIVTGDGNNISVSNDVYALATDPAVVAKAKRVVQPLRREGYDTLAFVDHDEIIDQITAAEAKAIGDAPSTLVAAAHEEISEIRGPIRIKSAQYEGAAKWSVLWGGKAIEVTMPGDWVDAFQANEIDAPPNTILDVVMEVRVSLDEKGNATSAPAYSVIEITATKPPPKPMKQVELF